MKLHLLFALLVSMLSVTWASADTSGESMGQSIGKIIGGTISEHPDWFKESFLEIADDVEEATAEGKHVLLFFYLESCPYCDKMVEENFEHSSYTDFLQQNFDIIAINIRGDREVAFNEEVSLTEKALARHLKVRYTPTIIFLDSDNQAVLRLNGYRSVESFEYALKYVQEKAYQQTKLSQYIEDNRHRAVYDFPSHPNFADADDLSRVSDKPLAVVFEDKTCDECDALHDNILSLSETKAILDKFTVVRFDAHSQEPLIDVNGKQSTPKAFAAALDISYRPGVVLFDQGREVLRIDGMLRTFHFQEALRYVGERQYLRYPKFRDYTRAYERKILNSGRDIDISK